MPPILRVAYKPDVRRRPAQRCLEEIEWALVETAPRLIEQVVLITSANDGLHMSGSHHYRDEALDVRILGDRVGGIAALYYAELLSMGMPRNAGDFLRIQQRIALEGWVPSLRAKLSGDYDIVYEGDHIHVEFDRKPVVQPGMVAGVREA